MSVATTSNYAALSSYIEKAGLAVAEPKLLYAKFGKKLSIPQKSSKVIKFRRYEKIAPTDGKTAASVKSLVEGQVPSETNPSVTDYTLTLSQYGNLMRFSDQAAWVNEVSVDTELMKRNSENMQETLDAIYRDGLMAGSNFGRLTDSIGTIGAGARTTVAGIVNGPALDKVVRILEAADAKYYAGGVAGSNKVGTAPVRPGFVCLVHPDNKFDLEKIPGYKSTSDYGSQEGLLDGEIGSYKNIRFVMSTRAKIFADSGASVSGTKSTTGSINDVYALIVIGQEAYACVDLASSAEIKYVPASSADHANPLGQYSSLGWKAMAGSIILNDSWLYRLEVAASA